MPETPDRDELFDVTSRAEEQVMRGFHESLEVLDGLRCGFCHLKLTAEEVDDPDAIYVQVASWVTGPKLQSPVLRAPTGQRAHRDCVRKQIDGEAPDQEPVPGLEFEGE